MVGLKHGRNTKHESTWNVVEAYVRAIPKMQPNKYEHIEIKDTIAMRKLDETKGRPLFYVADHGSL